ncbi:ABC transporter permease, partial [Geitlerinema calcuttense]
MLSQILSIPTSLGRTVLRFVDELGSLTLLVAETARSLVTARPRWKLTSYHIYNFGWTSQPVVLLTGAFVGMVFAAQIFWQLKKVQMENAVGSIVAVAMF